MLRALTLQNFVFHVGQQEGEKGASWRITNTKGTSNLITVEFQENNVTVTIKNTENSSTTTLFFTQDKILTYKDSDKPISRLNEAINNLYLTLH